jgi:hypothetical protein
MCTLNHERLTLIDDWLTEQRRLWEQRTDRLEQFVANNQEKQ